MPKVDKSIKKSEDAVVLYEQVGELLEKLNEIEGSYSDKNDKAYLAAMRLKDELKVPYDAFWTIMNENYKNMPQKLYDIAVSEFCKNSLKAIKKHEDKIMVAPGIWNNIKASVSSLVEKLTKWKINYEESAFSLSNKAFKDNFFKAKHYDKSEASKSGQEKDFEPPTMGSS